MSSISLLPRFRAAAGPARTTWRDALARRIVLRALQRLRCGQLTLIERDRRHTFGTAAPREDELCACVHVLHPRFYRMIAFGGALGAGEAHIHGYWTADDLTTLIRLLIVNETALSSLESGWGRLAAPLHKLAHALRRNTIRGARNNIIAHYDLSNEFYALWLDETMTYSSGIFERPESTLRDASLAKLDRICRKLDLRPGDHVLEIGTGWGSFAIHAATVYGCRVTTTTISDEQYELARARVRTIGMEHRITILKEDYRKLKGQYDKLVSIEMIEAVGWQYYDAFFAQCSNLLKPDGAALIQAIIMADRYYERAKHEVDFIKRYIFPGSCIPSLAALSRASGAGELQLWQLEDLTPHYATTLRMWFDNFQRRRDEIKTMGYPDEFLRMWEYYLCYCEAGFRERTIGCAQLLFTKPRCTLPTSLPRTRQIPEHSTN